MADKKPAHEATALVKTEFSRIDVEKEDGELAKILAYVLKAAQFQERAEGARKALLPCLVSGGIGSLVWSGAGAAGYVASGYLGVHAAIGACASILLVSLIASSANAMTATKLEYVIGGSVYAANQTYLGHLQQFCVYLVFPAVALLVWAYTFLVGFSDESLESPRAGVEEKQLVSDVMRDDRAKFLAETAAKIEAWNTDIHFVNRDIKIANAGLMKPEELNENLYEAAEQRRASLDKALTLAKSLLTEGPIGTVLRQPGAGKDSLHRLTDQLSEMDDRIAELRPLPTEERDAITEVETGNPPARRAKQKGGNDPAT